MRTGNLSTWLLRGTYPRLYVPIVLIIVLVSTVRYHYLVATETDEVRRHAATELRRAGDALLPSLAALPASDRQAQATLLSEGIASFGPGIHSLKWQVDNEPATEARAPRLPATAPDWFAQWVNIAPPSQQFSQALSSGGASGRLTVTLQAAPLVGQVWSTVVVQLRISALNIFTILLLLTLLLRANARMLRRLAEATDAFRQGRLDTRMEVTGTLESRAMAATFNDMAGKVQSLVLSLRETQQQQSEQLHFTRQLIDALPLPVFVRDADGTYVDTNRAWQRLFQAPVDPTGAHHTSNVPDALAPEHSAQVANAQDNVVAIHPLHAAHQPPLYMAYYEAPFTSTSGALAGTIGTLVDVTERKRAQEALQADPGSPLALISYAESLTDVLLDKYAAAEVLEEARALLHSGLWQPSEDDVSLEGYEYLIEKIQSRLEEPGKH